MKQAKRRLIKIRYGFQFIRRPRNLKKRIKKAQPTQSRQPNSHPSASLSQNIEIPEPTQPISTTDTTTALAHFDFNCNPYQQFIDNLCEQLPNLPKDTFTRSSLGSPVDSQPQSHSDLENRSQTLRPSVSQSSPNVSPSLHDLSNIPSCMLATKH